MKPEPNGIIDTPSVEDPTGEQPQKFRNTWASAIINNPGFIPTPKMWLGIDEAAPGTSDQSVVIGKVISLKITRGEKPQLFAPENHPDDVDPLFIGSYGSQKSFDECVDKKNFLTGSWALVEGVRVEVNPV